jgi:hypothetical protein
MNKAVLERRRAENEIVFRRFNESVFSRLNELDKVAQEEGVETVAIDEHKPLLFYCECSDENCKKRIKISPDAYARIHKNRDTFIIVSGHEVTSVEDVIDKNRAYYVVKKHKKLMQLARELHPIALVDTVS